LTVVHIDNHPDWVSWPRTFNCGGWVNRALELPHVRRVITLGPCSADLDLPEVKFANLRALESGRLEVYPWRHAPSRVFRRYGNGASHRTRAGHLVWTTLAETPWTEFVDALIARIPTEAVYLTLDKDALRSADAVTNWDQGEMSLEHVLTLIQRIAGARRLVGADVCGEYSPLSFSGWGRKILSWIDRGRPPAQPPDAHARNDVTNRRLLGAFLRCET
jgi:arginase family enzyme